MKKFYPSRVIDPRFQVDEVNLKKTNYSKITEDNLTPLILMRNYLPY